uniref:Phosphatidic acid phosphatase type 2/haloperoxidase domain-containing protein n=1 Tax=Romanomermis culicivorax TaxID=13658 RepID=A0A915IYI7_ROMCU
FICLPFLCFIYQKYRFTAFLPYICSKFFNPYKRGFYCNDDSIYYPFKKSTISSLNAKLFGFVIPILIVSCAVGVKWFSRYLRVLLIILTVEAYRTFFFEPKVAKKACEPKFSLFGLPCNPFATRLYFYIGYFLFGAALCLSLTKIGKFSIGRLRPHFMSVCRPSFNISECSDHKYIEEPHCTGDQDKIRNGRLSFPSGHSSFAFYTMMFAIFYIQAQVVWATVRSLIKPTLQFILFCLAFGTALSRISDYKHHWSDVFAGSIIGIICASAIVSS